jgi:hypothetical protein
MYSIRPTVTLPHEVAAALDLFDVIDLSSSLLAVKA